MVKAEANAKTQNNKSQNTRITGSISNRKSQKVQSKISDLAIKLGWQGDLLLLKQALTHPTFFEGIKSAENVDNQRLEFLGDAVLGILVGEELYNRYPDANEGYLSKMRSAMVCEGALADIARSLDLSDYLLMGKGSIKTKEQYRDSILADAFEAIIGAMYLQMGLDVVRNFIQLLFTSGFEDLSADKYEDYKGLMQQLVQSRGDEHLVYRLLGAEGPDHQRTYTVAIYYCGLKLGVSQGRSKKEAEQLAAALAWQDQARWLKILDNAVSN